MASEADSSLSAPSTTQGLARTSTIQTSTETRSRGPSAHTTWVHSRTAHAKECYNHVLLWRPKDAIGGSKWIESCLDP